MDESTKWLDEGYGVLSVSEENAQRVVEYIKNQKKHHAAKTRLTEFEMTQDWDGAGWVDSEIF
ncbi:MAG: hypothetical protein HY741_19870 [Chloroflexi bacterium]|nr:hypothetical protein [Chloroflexota bacterium]